MGTYVQEKRIQCMRQTNSDISLTSDTYYKQRKDFHIRVDYFKNGTYMIFALSACIFMEFVTYTFAIFVARKIPLKQK